MIRDAQAWGAKRGGCKPRGVLKRLRSWRRERRRFREAVRSRALKAAESDAELGGSGKGGPKPIWAPDVSGVIRSH